MMNLKKHISSNFLQVCFVLSIGLTACTEEKIDLRTVARVGSSMLTEAEVQAALQSKSGNQKYREEYIRRWVESELLYQEAVKEKIIQDPEFEKILIESRKSLAGGMLLSGVLKEEEPEIEESELEEYFEKKKDEFKITSKAYVLNWVCFNNKESVEDFRHRLLSSDWNEVLRNYPNDYIVESASGKFTYYYDINLPSVKRLLESIRLGDISVIIPEQPDKYWIFQIIRKYNLNDIPLFEDVKAEVEQRLRIIKEKQLYKNFIDELYSKYEVKIY